MRLPRGVAVSSYLAFLIAGLALHVLAQGPSTATSSDCPECDPLVRAVADDEAEIARLNAELERAKLEKYDEGIAKVQGSIDARKRNLRDDQAKLKTCQLRCAARKGVLPLLPLPPEIPMAANPEPHATCPECEKDARWAAFYLWELAKAEFNYLSYREDAFRLHAWLSGHTSEMGSDAYFAAYSNYADHLEEMSRYGERLKGLQADFDSAMKRLAECNAATKCEKSSAVTLGPQPILGPASAEVKAACADCEGEALAVRAALARLETEKAAFLYDTADRAAIVAQGGIRPLSDAEFATIKQREKDLKSDQENVARAEKQVEEARAALDRCNKKNCPPKATTPPERGGKTQPGGPGAPTTPPPTEGGATPGGAEGMPRTEGAKGGTGRTPTVPPTTTPPATTPPTTTPLPPGVAPPPDVKPLGNIDTVVPFAPGAPPPIVALGQQTVIGFDTYLTLLSGRSLPYEAPPRDLATSDRFTFVVPDGFLASVVLTNFNVHVIAFDPFRGRYLMGSDSGVDPDSAWSYLQGLLQKGVISDLEEDPCFAAASIPAKKESLEKVAHLSGSFGATLLDPVRQRPVAGASIIVGPLSPTPFFNPGERPGDDQPPTIIRTDSSGKYSASLSGLSGPVEISVAKGCDSHTSFAIADGPGNAPAVTAGAPVTQH